MAFLLNDDRDLSMQRLQAFLRNGGDIRTCNDELLRTAAQKGHLSIVTLLLRLGAGAHGEALVQAARYGHADIVRVLLLIGARDASALCLASTNGQTECVRLLLASGSDVHTDDDAALRNACSNGHTECVRLLLDAGANIHAWKDSPLCNAVSRNHVECVRLLLSAVPTNDGSAIRSASRHGNIEIVRILLEAGADVHAGIYVWSYRGRTSSSRRRRRCPRRQRQCTHDGVQ